MTADLPPVAAPDHDEHDHDDCPDCVPAAPYVREAPKIGRNDPCACGSGRKFKKCCGA